MASVSLASDGPRVGRAVVAMAAALFFASTSVRSSSASAFKAYVALAPAGTRVGRDVIDLCAAWVDFGVVTPSAMARGFAEERCPVPFRSESGASTAGARLVGGGDPGERDERGRARGVVPEKVVGGHGCSE